MLALRPADRVGVIYGARLFMSHLRDVGVIAAPAPKGPGDPDLLSAFGRWMRQQRGTCDATLYNYSIHLRELLELGKEPNQFDASMLRGFFLERNPCCGWGGENVHHGTSHVLAVSDR